MIGLSRAFLVAGARAVLVSQWSVSDEATAVLMSAFYRWYIELDDKAIALQKSISELRSNPAYAHPRFWAPFLVVGAEA
jgi:CHAT domain-containing protein